MNMRKSRSADEIFLVARNSGWIAYTPTLTWALSAGQGVWSEHHQQDLPAGDVPQ